MPHAKQRRGGRGARFIKTQRRRVIQSLWYGRSACAWQGGDIGAFVVVPALCRRKRIFAPPFRRRKNPLSRLSRLSRTPPRTRRFAAPPERRHGKTFPATERRNYNATRPWQGEDIASRKATTNRHVGMSTGRHVGNFASPLNRGLVAWLQHFSITPIWAGRAKALTFLMNLLLKFNHKEHKEFIVFTSFFCDLLN